MSGAAQPTLQASPNDEDMLRVVKNAAEMKEEGNRFFLEKNWTSAITAYKQALAYLPPSPPPPALPSSSTAPTDNEHEEEVAHAHATEKENNEAQKRSQNAVETEDQPGPMGNSLSTSQHQIMASPLEKECSDARVILYANIAACELKLEAWEAAVSAATAALNEDPHHAKSLWRRAKANEAIDSWSSLSAAQRDYTTLKEILKPSEPLYRDASSALRTLEPRIEVVRKRDTDKMLGQLKEVGNSVLGWFGLSTDNFQMTPNGQGGYSMNFVNQPNNSSTQ